MAGLRARQTHCNTCGGETKHVVLQEFSKKWEEAEGRFNYGINYQMLKCAGCETVNLMQTDWCDAVEQDTVRQYPPPTFRSEPKWLGDLFLAMCLDQDSVHDILREVYVALQNSQPYLAAMGIRALLEQMMIDKVGDHGTFPENTKAFEDAGYISVKQRERFKAVLEVGHAAMHRAHKPTRDELTTLMDLTEFFIQSVYIHDSKAENLKKRIPPRPPRIKKKPPIKGA